MDHPAALHRLSVGVPATVEHSSEASEGGAEMGKWVAETTQVSTKRASVQARRLMTVLHYIHGCAQAQPPCQRPTPPFPH